MNQQKLASVVHFRSRFQRAIALAQQVKDSITILLLLTNGMLFFGVFFGFAIPGLILYAVRWGLVRRTSGRGIWLWALSLVHELFCAMLFNSDHPLHADTDGHFEYGYLLGGLICFLGLLDSIGNWSDGTDDFDSE